MPGGGGRPASMAGEGDKRKRFISATAANYFGLDPAVGPAALAAGLHSRPELTNFLDDGNEFLLVVQRSGTQLTASNKVRQRQAEYGQAPVDPACPPHPSVRVGMQSLGSSPGLVVVKHWYLIWETSSYCKYLLQ